MGRWLLLCDGTLELETVASTRTRCVARRVRGQEEERTAGGAASREYDGRRARAMGVGPPFELASSPPFATTQIAYKSARGPIWVGPKLSLLLWETKLASLLVPFDSESSCSVASLIGWSDLSWTLLWETSAGTFCATGSRHKGVRVTCDRVRVKIRVRVGLGLLV